MNHNTVNNKYMDTIIKTEEVGLTHTLVFTVRGSQSLCNFRGPVHSPPTYKISAKLSNTWLC